MRLSTADAWPSSVEENSLMRFVVKKKSSRLMRMQVVVTMSDFRKRICLN